MSDTRVLIAGGGIGGLAMALTLHQIGVPCIVFESAREMRPLGVGINLQPNAVRELFDLGLKDHLERIGVRTKMLGFYSKFGKTIWEEPRGMDAGYVWPQYSVHRGELQVMLHDVLTERAGMGCIVTGMRAVGFENTEIGADLLLENGERVVGGMVIAADHLKSTFGAVAAASGFTASKDALISASL